MRRLLLCAIAMTALTAAPAHAATKSYSSGTINAPIPAGGLRERSIDVPDRGPVSLVRVSFRIGQARDADLAISLISPQGTEVPLVVRRGEGADFGSGAKGCNASQTVLDADWRGNPIARGAPPFTDSPYRPEGSLKRLNGEEARGRWTLRIRSSGSAGALYCFGLDISRSVPETITARAAGITAAVTSTERFYVYGQVKLKVVRRGKTVVDSPARKLSCPVCAYSRPTRLELVDLDGGEPEVLLELYTGGAHCCTVTLVLGWDVRKGRYTARLADWGNYGYRLIDLDRDGLPEFSAYDERFAYAFTAYAFSAAPVEIWRYELHRFSNVTDEFPREIEKDAAGLWKSYLEARKDRENDLRGILAAYVADLYLLGRGQDAQRVLTTALGRGDLRGMTPPPAGKAFIAELMKALHAWGYVRS